MLDADPDPHQFADNKPKWMEYEPTVFDPYRGDMLDADPDPHQFADNKPKWMEYEPTVFEHFFKVLSLYLKDKIRIRIKVTSRIRIHRVLK